ncbi:MAG TPA: lytic transglycosylase domain-containing protein [Pyrinomonadaceae bacterium]|nr:lytic transglycosylase domain-containing protein [Pyrinomonadaceae bacterium]
MTKFSLTIITICFLVISANAQIRNRLVIDNFELASGVSVKPAATPAPAPAPAPTKKLAKKTSQTTMNMQDAVSLKDSPLANTKLTMSGGNSMGGFTTGDATIDSYIVDSSNRYGIDPLLIYSQMSQESSFKLTATSNKGARGLMQLMPATAVRFGVTNIYEPRQNIDAGVKYMRWLLDTFNGDVSLALAGYNAGEGAVMKYGWQIPPYNETREYVRRISNRYNSIRNPNYVKTVKKVTATEVAKLEKKAPAPLTVYEANPVTVRLPDGRMRLVNK